MTQKTRTEIREEALRPSRYLGYDRDALGTYLLSRGALEIAEGQFRRAVWVNPFELSFKVHLAWCVYKQGRLDEARAGLEGICEDTLEKDLQSLFRHILESEAKKNTNG